MAVINATTRQRFFGGRPAVGQTIEADGQRFRVVGVVEDVSELRQVPFADIWVPYTTAKTDAYKSELMGGLHAIALARGPGGDGGDPRRVQLARCSASSCPIPRTTQAIVAPFETKFEGFARDDADQRPQETRSSQVWRSWSALLAVPRACCSS